MYNRNTFVYGAERQKKKLLAGWLFSSLLTDSFLFRVNDVDNDYDHDYDVCLLFCLLCLCVDDMYVCVCAIMCG